MVWWCELCCCVQNRLAPITQGRQPQLMMPSEVPSSGGEGSATGTQSFPLLASVDEEHALCASLENMANRLARTVQKFPHNAKSSMLGLRKPVDRYLAILPQAVGGDSVYGAGELGLLERFRCGWLAWWDNERACTKGDKPKGYISLLRITRVHHERVSMDARGVLVKHKKGDSPQEFLFLLPTKREAQEFAYMLWEFLSKLRGEWNAHHPSISMAATASGNASAKGGSIRTQQQAQSLRSTPRSAR